jgi:hypothetical protein
LGWNRECLLTLRAVGYLIAWRNEGIAGALFICWWMVIWGVDLLVWAPTNPSGSGIGIVAGFPLFVVGLLFLRARYRGKIVPGEPPES